MSGQRAVIAGVGLCTALGASAETTWAALLAGQFITDHSRATGDYSSPRAGSLALAAAGQAVADAQWGGRELAESALVVGTSKGPIESWIAGPDARLPLGLGEVAASVAGGLGLGTGPRLTVSTACASGLHALIRAAMMIEDGAARALVVAAESSLHPLFLGSFRRLGVLAPAEIGCRPFDENRAGFLVSEAAAAVCLEPAGRGDGTGGRGVVLERFAMGADAAHLTGGDPSAATLRRLLTAVIDGRGVDLVHAHATGTVFNDPVELAAIEASVAGGPAAIYSHKAALGHSLGAAGLVAVVINCLAHRNGAIPPAVRTSRALKMKGVFLNSNATAKQVRRSIAVASGFGGAAAALSLLSV